MATPALVEAHTKKTWPCTCANTSGEENDTGQGHILFSTIQYTSWQSDYTSQ